MSATILSVSVVSETDLLVAEDADLEVVRPHQQLQRAVLVHIAEGHRADVVAGHSPVRLVALVVEALDRAVAADEGQWRVAGRAAKDAHHDRVHAVGRVLEEQVAFSWTSYASSVVCADQQHLAVLFGIEQSARQRRYLAIDVQQPNLVLWVLLIRAVKEDLARRGATCQRRGACHQTCRPR